MNEALGKPKALHLLFTNQIYTLSNHVTLKGETAELSYSCPKRNVAKIINLQSCTMSLRFAIAYSTKTQYINECPIPPLFPACLCNSGIHPSNKSSYQHGYAPVIILTANMNHQCFIAQSHQHDTLLLLSF